MCKYERGIYTQENAIPEELCKRIIEAYEADSTEDNVMSETGSKNYRKCPSLVVSELDHWVNLLKEFNTHFVDSISNFLKSTGIQLPPLRDSGFTVCKYRNGDYCEPHFDGHTYYKGYLRTVAYLVFLNDCEEPIKFPHQKMEVMPKVGKIVMFPVGYTHPHKVDKITNGPRYTMISWLFSKVLTKEEGEM
jgi:predicted 2-oxoglutarate/Fe(II)-dependent dioxygenase YbiX